MEQAKRKINIIPTPLLPMWKEFPIPDYCIHLRKHRNIINSMIWSYSGVTNNTNMIFSLRALSKSFQMAGVFPDVPPPFGHADQGYPQIIGGIPFFKDNIPKAFSLFPCKSFFFNTELRVGCLFHELHWVGHPFSGIAVLFTLPDNEFGGVFKDSLSGVNVAPSRSHSDLSASGQLHCCKETQIQV